MHQSNSFSTPYLLSSSKKQIATSERKINLLETRFNGPSKDGLSPIEVSTFSFNDINNFKKELFQNELISLESTKSSSHKSDIRLSPDSNSTYLQSKRNRQSIISLPSEQQHIKVKTNNSKFNKSSIRTKSKKEHIENNLKMNDYYSKINSNQNSFIESLSRANYSSLNSNENEFESIINEKDQIINAKDEEICRLKQIIEEYKESYEALSNYNNKYITEIDKFQNDIIAFVKEIGELKRQIMKRDINDKQYTIGKYISQKVFNGQIIEYWEEGQEVKKLNQKYLELKQNKNELQSLLQSNDVNNKEMIKFRLSCMQKEETELKYLKDALNKQSILLNNNINLIKNESKCTYANNWPLIGNKYQLVSLLGQGGYSEVYKAYDIKSHKYAACKIHKVNTNWKEEVKDNYIKHTIREDRIMKEFTHENIVTLYDTIEINNNAFCSVLELCSGPDLDQYIKEKRYLQEIEAKAIILKVLKALEYLNNLNQKIIHYDIKPQNIIFHNNMTTVKLTDFGLAKIIDANESETDLTSQGAGTYAYLPPECFEKRSEIKIDNKVDIWSVGVVFYEMLYGKKPFRHDCPQEKVAYDIVVNSAKTLMFYDDINKISTECKYFIKKCLELDPSKRYDVFSALKSRFIDSNS